MKTIRRFTLFLVLAFAPAAFATTVEMDVNGLVCAFCAQGIEKTLKGYPQAGEVLVSLEHRLVAFELKPGTDIDDATLRKALTDSGYTVVAIRRTDATIAQLREKVRKDG